MDKYNNADWIVPINDPHYPRNGVSIRHIISGNDGDICLAALTCELLKNKINPLCVDIGVDQGWWSFFVIDKNKSASVISFEPNPLSYNNLIPYIKNEPRIQLHNLAISDTNGVIPFTLGGGQSHSRDKASALMVKCSVINSFIEGKSIDIMKIDTEGHELHILPTLYPYLSQIESLIFEVSVEWYNDDYDTYTKMFNHLLSVYPAVYYMSRNGNPRLTKLTKTNLEELKHFKHIQWDAFLSRHPNFT